MTVGNMQPDPAWNPIRSTPIRTGWLARSVFVALIALGVWSMTLHNASAQDDLSDVNWLTGRSFQEQLQNRLQLRWQDVMLRESLMRFSANQRIAIFLDRRVDPNQKVDFVSGDVTLDELFARLASQLGLDYCVIENVVYIGPFGAADQVHGMSVVLKEALRGDDVASREQWFASASTRWQRLARPNTVIQSVVDDAGLPLADAQLIPHDLWPGYHLPPLTLFNRLTLLLAGFSLTIEPQQERFAARVVPLPERVVYEHEYRLARGTTIDANELKSRFDDVDVSVNGNRVLVTASSGEHRMVKDLLEGRPVYRRTDDTESEKTYTLQNSTSAAGSVVASVAQQLGVEVRYEDNAMELLRQTVTVDVENVSLDELLKKALDPVGATYELTDASLIIRPK